jgi:hypothetical protein
MDDALVRPGVMTSSARCVHPPGWVSVQAGDQRHQGPYEEDPRHQRVGAMAEVLDGFPGGYEEPRYDRFAQALAEVMALDDGALLELQARRTGSWWSATRHGARRRTGLRGGWGTPPRRRRCCRRMP